MPLVENGRIHRGDVVIETVAREYLQDLMDEGVDTLILGCTHFPLLKDVIGDIMGSRVTLIDSGEAAAEELKQLLEDCFMLAEEADGDAQFYVSDQAADFNQIAAVFLGENMDHAARRINIEQY